MHYEPILVEISLFERGVGHFERKFQGERSVPTNEFWHPKNRVLGLSYGENKLPKISTAGVGCTNVTDRQTDDRQTDRQTERRWHIANVNVSSRSLKIHHLNIIIAFHGNKRPHDNTGHIILFIRRNIMHDEMRLQQQNSQVTDGKQTHSRWSPQQ